LRGNERKIHTRQCDDEKAEAVLRGEHFGEEHAEQRDGKTDPQSGQHFGNIPACLKNPLAIATANGAPDGSTLYWVTSTSSAEVGNGAAMPKATAMPISLRCNMATAPIVVDVQPQRRGDDIISPPRSIGNATCFATCFQ